MKNKYLQFQATIPAGSLMKPTEKGMFSILPQNWGIVKGVKEGLNNVEAVLLGEPPIIPRSIVGFVPVAFFRISDGEETYFLFVGFRANTNINIFYLTAEFNKLERYLSRNYRIISSGMDNRSSMSIIKFLTDKKEKTP